jgi:SAM-dependent methyltransferase/chorismate mutase
MDVIIDLKDLGERLAVVDATVMRLIKHRMDLARLVGENKIETEKKIFRSDIEDERIGRIVSIARELGLNPHFATSLLYLLINESCKLQMIQLQEGRSSNILETESEWHSRLKRNLLQLTERWCETYDDHYDEGHFATREYLAYEQEIVTREISKLDDRHLFLDLGCATGRMTFQVCDTFERVVGFDLSQHMVTNARRQADLLKLESQVSFEQIDLEEGIPIPNESVSFVMMNLGTASDIPNFDQLLQEILRVLIPGGRFMLSFYNREALVYRWELLPWDAGLAARIDLRRDCLDVHTEEGMVSVYARAYTVAEVTNALRETFDLNIITYPTISAILPNEVFTGQAEMEALITQIDQSLVESGMGAYIIATGQKR